MQEAIPTREQLRAYMSRAGMSSSEVAEETGYSKRTIIQFISYTTFGTGNRETGETAARLQRWMDENPLPARQLPGKLYPTAATREMDRLLDWCKSGGWGTMYGPAGAQKSFLLSFRAAEAAREPEPAIALVEVAGAWSPTVFFLALASEMGVGTLGTHSDLLRRGILRALRRRRSPLAIVIDEADMLYSRVDTLQAIRRLIDLAAGRAGLLVAGNEEIEKLFEPRRKSYMEQWRSRIEQERIRVLGPTVPEARGMVAAEVPGLAEEKVERLLRGCTVNDPMTRRDYVSTRRLFTTLEKGRRRSKATAN